MEGFKELGKKLDSLVEKIKSITQEGMEKTAEEAKDWRKKLDELGEKIKKTTLGANRTINHIPAAVATAPPTIFNHFFICPPPYSMQFLSTLSWVSA